MPVKIGRPNVRPFARGDRAAEIVRPAPRGADIFYGGWGWSVGVKLEMWGGGRRETKNILSILIYTCTKYFIH